MILTGKSVKLEDKTIRHDFWVVGTTPTSAKVTYDVVNTSDKVIYTTTEQYPLQPLGSDRYRFEAYIPADRYTVKLDTEANYLEYESEYSINNRLTDAPLIAERGSGTVWIYFWLPMCDTSKINVEFYSPEGKPLEFKNSSHNRKAWEITGRTVFNVDGKQRLYVRGRIYIYRVRESGSTWVLPTVYNSIYVRVLGITPILTNSLLTNALLDQDAFKASTRGKLVTL